MRTLSKKRPILRPSEPGKYDPQKAVAILAGFTAKYQGGNRVKQDKAAMIAVNLLSEGVPAVEAIESAVKKVLQPS
jgi:hypothetical protein